MKKRLSAFYVAGLSIGLSACQGIGIIEPGMPDYLANSHWILTAGQYQGKPLNTAAGKITLNIEPNGQLNGVAAVNHYNIPTQIHGNRLEHTGTITTTRMAGSIPAMRLESNYLSAMRHADTLTVEENTLIIRGNTTELSFQPALSP